MEEINQLKAQLDLMQAALDHINQGFTVFDRDLRLVAWNRGLYDMLDMPKDIVKRGSHLEAFIRVNAERGEYGAGDIEGKIARRIERAKLFEPHYFERIRPNGQIIAVSGTPLPQGGFVTIYSDVTEERRRQETLEQTVAERSRALQQSEDWLRLVTDNIPALIAYLSPGPVFRFANRRYAEWFGQSVTSIAGRGAKEVVGAELFGELEPHIERAFSGNAVSYEYQRERPDGTNAFMRSTLIPDMTKDGRTLGIFVLSLDATDQKQAEAALVQSQRMDAVGKLTGGLAHDFNNLLAIIMGNLLSLNRAETPIARTDLDRKVAPMLDAAQRGSDLIERLLAFSRGKAIDPQVVALADILTSAKTLLEGSLPSSIDLKLDANDNHIAALIDPTQMETVLINLAFNARDAMPDGGVLSVSLSEADLGTGEAEKLGVAPGHYALVSVRDTGIGMDQETRLKIFEPFFTTKSFGTGSGLGLSTVYGFIHQSGGAIDVQSAPGAGTCFSIYLPFTQCVSGPGNASEPSSWDETLKGEGELILLAEDDPSVAQAVTDQLQRLGYSVLQAESAEDAKNLALTLPDIKCLLSDIIMPGQLNGLALARSIRKDRPDLGIALMTGYTDWSALAGKQASCEFTVLAKPFSDMQLAETITHVLSSANGTDGS
ncbi:PAS domain S-box protein [Roseibium denhamense]|uniref:histidine kinase n=1 Tax=Roseibium denhamense TaxID=76305 RepID=A0ABY1NKQ9_9HYPH|nr:PAS-domain containing protein [Roseibium denhamense]MTI06860.1 PAS domain S-box protein [Roseibium denhamense]SMP12082.1 PAS domain S-box-containing protein [Roseibium denhamense]